MLISSAIIEAERLTAKDLGAGDDEALFGNHVQFDDAISLVQRTRTVDEPARLLDSASLLFAGHHDEALLDLDEVPLLPQMAAEVISTGCFGGGR